MIDACLHLPVVAHAVRHFAWIRYNVLVLLADQHRHDAMSAAAKLYNNTGTFDFGRNDDIDGFKHYLMWSLDCAYICAATLIAC